MKKLLLAIVLFATADTQHIFAQDGSAKNSLSALLNSYYSIKNELVNSDANATSGKAAEFIKAVDGADMMALSAADHKVFMAAKDKLVFDARHIAESKDIAHQREHFSSLSNNVYKFAKAVKLSATPVYQQYCPMKKTYWLSSETAIKNPYYGKAMLTCGKVSDTIQ